MISIITNEFDFNVNSGLYVIELGAIWCGPCKRLEPVIKQLESEFNVINFMSVDVDQVPTLAQRYRVRTVPTLLFIKDGLEVNRVIGLSLIEPLRKILRDLSKDTEILHNLSKDVEIKNINVI
jgi:thioredoxin 1